MIRSKSNSSRSQSGRKPLIEQCEPRQLFTAAGINLDVYAATDVEHGTEIWVRDAATLGNAHLLKDIVAGAESSSPFNLFAYNGKAYFNVRDAAGNYALWQTDGTEQGTVPWLNETTLADIMTKNWSSGGGVIRPWDFPSRPSPLGFSAVVGTRHLFSAGNILYATDGTLAGTRSLFGVGNIFVVSHDRLFIQTSQSERGSFGVTVTDGTIAGTYSHRMPNTITSGFSAFSSYFVGLSVSNGQLRWTISDKSKWDAHRMDYVSSHAIALDIHSTPPPTTTDPNVTPKPPVKVAYLANRELFIKGTSQSDRIEVKRSPSSPRRLVVTVNGMREGVFNDGDMLSINIVGGAGDDIIRISNKYGPITRPAYISGDAGNDSITGTDSDDTLFGGDGNDVIYGAGGRDSIHGDAGTDYLYGGDGTDVFFRPKNVELRDLKRNEQIITI